MKNQTKTDVDNAGHCRRTSLQTDRRRRGTGAATATGIPRFQTRTDHSTDARRRRIESHRPGTGAIGRQRSVDHVAGNGPGEDERSLEQPQGEAQRPRTAAGRGFPAVGQVPGGAAGTVEMAVGHGGNGVQSETAVGRLQSRQGSASGAEVFEEIAARSTAVHVVAVGHGPRHRQSCQSPRTGRN